MDRTGILRVFARPIKTSVFLCLVLSLFSPETQAFKINTHVWVGQQVLNDVVPDGLVTINGHEYTVAPNIVNALRLYPSEYRMGNVGPDGFPDVITGQMTTHPGVAGAWQTDDWLAWILSGSGSDPQKTAFNYGYVSHAASDVFSHSYVNTYSGGIFVLLHDGQGVEQEVEVRHFALESYIARRTPPLYDHTGAYLGRPEDVVAAPAAYLRDHLIFNDTVKGQYQAQDVQFITPHLPAMYDVYRGIDDAIDKVNKVEGIIDNAISSYLVRIAGVENKITDFTNNIERLHNEILTNNGLIDAARADIALKKTLLQLKIDEISRLQGLIADLQNLVDQRNALVNDWQDKLANTVQYACQNYCPPAGPPGCGGFPRPPCAPSPCEWTCTVLNEWTNVNNQLQDALGQLESSQLDLAAKLLEKTAAQKAKADLELAIAALEAQIKTAEAAIALAEDLIAQHQAAREQARADLLNLKHELEQTQLLKPAHIYRLRTLLTNWRRDVERAGEAYIGASGEMSKIVMRGQGNLIKPMTDWLSCWGPVFGGVPSQVPNALCAGQRAIDQVAQAVTDFRNDIGDLAWLIDPAGQLQQEILNRLKPKVEQAAARLAEKVGKQEMADMILLESSPGVDEVKLNSIFASDSTGRNLLLIGDVGARVNADMHLTAQGYFDPNLYRMVRNAVVLAKLTLLAPDQLNQLYVDLVYNGTLPAAAVSTEYGPDLYTGTPGFNLLIGAIRSIDGNQQWQELGLPYPRLPGLASDPLWPVPTGVATWAPPVYPAYDDTSNDSVRRRFGNRFCDLTYCSEPRGFRFWQDDTAREKVFKSIFQGPVAPGVEYPAEFGMSELLPATYPFRACPQNPFPRTTVTNWQAPLMRDATGVVRDSGCDEDYVVNITVQPRGRNYIADAVVTNNGARPAPATEVFFYLSQDQVLDQTDQAIGQRNIHALAIGESMNVMQPVILPPRTPSGTYYVIAFVDPLSRTPEARENNNQFVIAVTAR